MKFYKKTTSKLKKKEILDIVKLKNSHWNFGISSQLKWFNNKSGYGFITSCDEKNKDEDVFVHHSSISVSAEQYKYLVQGEYVSLDVEKSEKGDYVFQTTKVTGVFGGALMCETRQDIRNQRAERVKDMGEFQESYKKRGVRGKPRNNLDSTQRPGLERQETQGEFEA